MNKCACISILLAAIVLAGCVSVPSNNTRPAVGWTSHLDEVGLNGKMDSLPIPRDWKLRQISSFDKQGGNDDASGYIYAFDEGKVIANLKGPGCILRIWAEEPDGLIAFYVDDMQHAALVLPFAELFTGFNEVFSPPLVGQNSGGCYSYVPIPYKEKCLIAVYDAKDEQAYHITYADLPGDDDIEPFRLPLNRYGDNFFRRWRNEWNRIPDVRMSDLETEKLHQSSRKIYPNKESLVYSIEGPAVVKEIEFEFGVKDPATLHKIWVAMYFDGDPKPSVYGPVDYLFGAGSPTSADYMGLAIGRDGGRLWCRYPMPFASMAQIRLFNTSDAAFDFKYNITWEPRNVDGMMYFHALYNEDEAETDENYTVANITGHGQFAGCSVAVNCAKSFEFLEGDDIVVVDGKCEELLHGTGTDDYFNAGNQFQMGSDSTAMYGCTVLSKSDPVAFSAYRSHVTDAIPFKKSFALSFEKGNQNNESEAVYSSMAYWYQKGTYGMQWTTPELGMEVVK